MLGAYAYTDPKSMSVCIYPISCTTYATEILTQKPFIVACYLITKRVLSCNPLGAWWLRYTYKKTAPKD
jgi:putative component of membrane protein insertase Oxa1/YidC/SpoIIIJ protein YidD